MIAGASFEQALSWDVLQSSLPIASPRFGADETTMLRWGILNSSTGGAPSDPACLRIKALVPETGAPISADAAVSPNARSPARAGLPIRWS
jgi:hypothetical protein